MSFNQFCRKRDLESKMQPVPRSLSSSCGICVILNTDTLPSLVEHEDYEACYQVMDNEQYLLLDEQP